MSMHAPRAVVVAAGTHHSMLFIAQTPNIERRAATYRDPLAHHPPLSARGLTYWASAISAPTTHEFGETFRRRCRPTEDSEPLADVPTRLGNASITPCCSAPCSGALFLPIRGSARPLPHRRICRARPRPFAVADRLARDITGPNSWPPVVHLETGVTPGFYQLCRQGPSKPRVTSSPVYRIPACATRRSLRRTLSASGAEHGRHREAPDRDPRNWSL